MSEGVTQLSRADYLKRYLNPEEDASKKKKRRKIKEKPAVKKLTGFRIIDDDINLKDIAGPKVESDLEEEDEAPEIAEVIDDTPLEVRIRQQYDSSRWKTLEGDSEGEEEFRQSSNSLAKDSDSDSSLRNNSSSRSASKAKISSSNRYDSDSDLSPERPNTSNKQRHNSEEIKYSQTLEFKESTTKRRKSRFDSDSDLSPERSSPKESKQRLPKEENDSDSDFSPPRKNDPQTKKRAKLKGASKEGSGEPQTSKHGASYSQSRLKEDESNMMVKKVQLRGKRKQEEEEKKHKEELERAAKEAKYSEWGKGLVQNEERQRRFQEDSYETSKPLARYKDDEDLDHMLKEKMYADDPMFEYMKKKKRQKSDLPGKVMPKYSGPPGPANRFGISPGYRWDGVDRSNGFEKKYFASLNDATSRNNESYLWSVQDM